MSRVHRIPAIVSLDSVLREIAAGIWKTPGKIRHNGAAYKNRGPRHSGARYLGTGAAAGGGTPTLDTAFRRYYGANIDGTNNSSLSDGNAIGTWVEHLATGDDITQSSESKKPTFVASDAVIAKPCVNFLDSSFQELNLAAWTGGAISQTYVVALVMRIDNVAGQDYVFSGGAGPYPSLVRDGVTDNRDELQAGSNIGIGNNFDTNAEWHSIIMTFAGASTTVMVDGSSSSPGNPGTNTLDGFNLGDRSDGTVPFKGRVADCIIFDSAVAEADINTDLVTLYGSMPQS